MEASVRRKKDIKAELLRTMACFMVILVHIRLLPIVDGQVIKTPVFMGCFLSSCVGIFFLVTGFFMYDGRKSIWGVVKGFLVKILSPTLLIVFFSLIFNDWILGQASFSDCIKSADYIGSLKSVADGVLYISSDYWGFLCAHLWYIAEYAKLILFFPAVLILVRHASDKVLMYLAGLNVFFCMTIDLYRTFANIALPYVEPFLRPSQALVLIGCILYRHRERLKSRRNASFFLFAAYLCSVLWMFYAQLKQFETEGIDWPGAYFTTWLSGIGMVSAILLVAFVLSLPDHLKVWKWLEKSVIFIGDLSFLIYLVQYAVIMKFSSGHVRGYFFGMAVDPVGTILYYILYGSFIFTISAGIAFLMKMAGGFLMKREKFFSLSFSRKMLDKQKPF